MIRELAAGGGRRMLFTRTKHSAKKWAAALSKQGIPAVDLHGNLSQNARERNLAAFSSGSAKVLVATDIAARGIHVDDVELVVHLDPPTEHKAYLHRSGRTARAGAGGTVDHRHAAGSGRRRAQADEAGRHHRRDDPGVARVTRRSAGSPGRPLDGGADLHRSTPDAARRQLPHPASTVNGR